MRRALPNLLILALLLLSVPAAAQTPDGSTPALETVCAKLKFSTPGLYGLCVAYCEAHDADLDLLTKEPKDTSPASDKILENYNKKKSAADPDMPCRRPVCPCFSAEDLQALDFSVSGSCNATGGLLQIVGFDANKCEDTAFITDQKGLACGLFEQAAPEEGKACQMRTSTRQTLTVQQYTACAILLKEEIARRQLRCALGQ